MPPLDETNNQVQTDRRIPPAKTERDRIRRAVAEFAARNGLTPPLSFERLRKHTEALLAESGIAAEYMDFSAVVLNNELWRPAVEAAPYGRRLLLLPQCLRDAVHCPAETDQYGLLCRHCGRCVIDTFTRRAESLGYAVLVAEGSPVVMALIESGQVEAVVGVSCLSVLEKVFPYMEAGAVPGMAVPLLREGCKDTVFDTDWLTEALENLDLCGGRPLPLDTLKQTVRRWFERDCLETLPGPADSPVRQLALDWLAGSGKRWRPLLTAGMYAVCSGQDFSSFPVSVQQAALAIECFHKASLVHDDIEDNDLSRYGRQTLHVQKGIPIALNVGDFLLGEGYRLLSQLPAEESRKNQMLAVAAMGHRTLCLGQGAELDWVRNRTEISSQQVLEIFAQKTAPAFEVALKLGAILAGAEDPLHRLLEPYSRALGIAYQIRDDLRDWKGGDGSRRPEAFSILSVLAYEKAEGEDRRTLKTFLQSAASTPGQTEDLCGILRKPEIELEARRLLEYYKEQALQAMEPIRCKDTKTFLRRLITRIFDDPEQMGCCDEYSPETDSTGF